MKKRVGQKYTILGQYTPLYKEPENHGHVYLIRVYLVEEGGVGGGVELLQLYRHGTQRARPTELIP